MKTIAIYIVTVLLAINAYASPVRHELEDKALQYFIDHAHPVTGLVRDKALNFEKTPSGNIVSSLAATGFGLAVIAHAGVHGKLPKEDAIQYVRKTLRFTLNHVPRYRGWLLHFVDWSNGKRIWESEYSTIDTALYLAGALYAAKVLHDEEISTLSMKLYQEVDFHDMMTDGGAKPNKRTITLSYTPEKGYVPYQWDSYAEQAILLVLALGHPTKPLPGVIWKKWRRTLMGLNMPLFIHQYSLLFLDFRVFEDQRKNYFQAGLDATFLQRNALAKDGYWGLSAGESKKGYAVYSPLYNDGTFCVGCAAGSIMFAPDEVYSDVSRWSKDQKVWGIYGLVDSLNVSQNWYSPYVLGITKGPEYLSSVNAENATSLWYEFMSIPSIKKAMQTIQKEALLDQ